MWYSISSLIFVVSLVVLTGLLGQSLLLLLGLRDSPGNAQVTSFLALPLGLGVVITLLFVLALSGSLAERPLLIAGSTLLLAATGVLWLKSRARPANQESLRPGARSFYWLLMLGILVAYSVFAALGAPLEWDELSYHLPYARDYAEQGGLVVSEYLRFPLHSHNFHLLYSAALIFSSEAATHLLNAMSGLLVAVGIVIFCREYLDAVTGVVAAMIYLALTATYFNTAYVDLGMGLFVFSAFIALAAWQKSAENSYLYLAAFLLAIAAGTKYQGLAQLGPFLLALLAATRSPRHFLGVAMVLFLFGSWWYLRNLVISGDPVHPMGGPYFGFWLWNEADLNDQLGDVGRYRDHLPLVLVPALGSVFLLKSMGARYRTVVILGLAGLALWYLTSRYERYLVPTLPFLAILSAHVSWRLVRKLAPRVAEYCSRQTWWPGLSLALLALAAVIDLAGKWPETCFTQSCVDKVHSSEILSYRLSHRYPGFDSLKLYQLGLENEIYYLGKPVIGDWFGPYRYRDVLSLGGEGGATATHLRELGANSLLINRTRPKIAEYLRSSTLEPELVKAYEDEGVVLYILPE
jgi:hypothetical protein